MFRVAFSNGFSGADADMAIGARIRIIATSEDQGRNRKRFTDEWMGALGDLRVVAVFREKWAARWVQNRKTHRAQNHA